MIESTFATLAGCLLVLVLAGCTMSMTEDTPVERDPEGMGAIESGYYARHYRDQGLQGFTQRPGLRINWAGSTDNGANVDGVIAATIERIQFEQTTNLASDSQAKALVLLMQARQELAGGLQVTEDGLPILE